jgi:hypothetical protein
MKVRIKINRNWSNQVLDGIDRGLLELTTDIDRRSAILVAKDTRALLNSRLIQRIGKLAWRITYGNSRVPYAEIRHEVNFKTPSSVGYLEKAGEGVIRGAYEKYFRNKGI